MSAATLSAPDSLSLSPREAARALGISERTLRRRTQPDGPIPVVRLGSRVLYPVDALREWLANATEANSTEATK